MIAAQDSTESIPITRNLHRGQSTGARRVPLVGILLTESIGGKDDFDRRTPACLHVCDGSRSVIGASQGRWRLATHHLADSALDGLGFLALLGLASSAFGIVNPEAMALVGLEGIASP